MAADASGKPELLIETESNAIPDSCAPDGKTLVFSQAGPDKKIHLWSVTVPGGKAVRLHEGDALEWSGEVSPDGHWLAYESTESGSNEVYVQPFPVSGSKTRISTEGGSVPRWAHSGKELFYWNFGVEHQLFTVERATRSAFPRRPPATFVQGRCRNHLGCRRGRQAFPGGNSILERRRQAYGSGGQLV